MINRHLFYPIYTIPVINVQKNTLKFHTTYFYNTRFYIPVIFTIPCFYIPVPQKKGQFIPAFINTSSNIIVRGPIGAIFDHYMVKKFRATCDISKQIDDHFLFITFLFSKFIYYYFKKYSQFPSFTLSSEPSHIPLINML
jgi:hypothetical protein